MAAMVAEIGVTDFKPYKHSRPCSVDGCRNGAVVGTDVCVGHGGRVPDEVKAQRAARSLERIRERAEKRAALERQPTAFGGDLASALRLLVQYREKGEPEGRSLEGFESWVRQAYLQRRP